MNIKNLVYNFLKTNPGGSRTTVVNHFKSSGFKKSSICNYFNQYEDNKKNEKNKKYLNFHINEKNRCAKIVYI